MVDDEREAGRGGDQDLVLLMWRIKKMGRTQQRRIKRIKSSTIPEMKKKKS